MEQLYSRIVHGNVVYVELAGSSSETPPTENIAAGSWFHEVDTATLKSYDDVAGQWVPQIELGGASSDARSMRAVPTVESTEEPTEPAEEPEEPTEPAGSDER